MKLIKKIIIKTIHFFGYDIIRIDQKSNTRFLGLENFPIRSVIDIGANRGQFARKALMSFSGAKIYCFEPLRVPFEDLKKWAKEEKRVSAFNFALGDKEGEIEMFLHSEHDDSSSVLGTTETCEKIYAATKKQRKVSVPQITLDKAAEKLLKDSLVPEILVKVDVQGYEKHVISGGKEVLSRTKACILEVCSDRLYQGQTDFREIFLLMDSLGFTYIGNLEQVSATDGHVVHFDAVFIRK